MDDVETILAPMRKKFAVYQVDVLQGMPNTTSYYNKTFSIPSEGVFSTYFLFGQHRVVDPDAEPEGEEKEGLDGFIDDIFGDDRENEHAGPGHRALTPAHNFNKKQPHLLIHGQISFVNSFGFLNADQYPLMQFYLIMFFIYTVAVVIWVRLMRKYGENKVSLHNYFCLLFVVTCLESALFFVEYDLYND